MKKQVTIILITLINIHVMAKEIKTEIIIHASPERVWEILMDFDSYPDWNPFIISIIGRAEVGEKIKAHIVPQGAKGMTFKPVVLVKKENEELKWLGNLLFKGLFDGEHQFVIQDNGDGTVLFQQNETFTGLLVKVFPKSLYTNSMAGFEAMNLALKERAENSTN